MLSVFILSPSNFSSLSPAYILPFLLSTLAPSSHHREEEEEDEEEEEEEEEEDEGEGEEDEEDEEDEEEADDESHPVTEPSRQGAHRYFRPSGFPSAKQFLPRFSSILKSLIIFLTPPGLLLSCILSS